MVNVEIQVNDEVVRVLRVRQNQVGISIVFDSVLVLQRLMKIFCSYTMTYNFNQARVCDYTY